jgi:hypothetical protein
MKHGDKAKETPAKAKASGKKASAPPRSEGGGKAVQSSKAPQSSAGKESSGKKAVAETGKAGGNGKGAEGKGGKAADAKGKSTDAKAKGRVAAAIPESGFTNPTVGAGFKRAVKKFPTAFRKLTD